MKVIGVTGGVGSGKSRVLAILKEDFGAEIILADEVARQLEEPGQPGLALLTRHFGDGILGEDGSLDRARLASIIFQDEAALEAVNHMIHPLVWETIGDMISSWEKAAMTAVSPQPVPVVAVESALFDKRTRSICDEVWLIHTSDENRIRRLMENRGYTREKCVSIIRNQKSREEFLEFCDVVIHNDGSIEQVRQQIHKQAGRLGIGPCRPGTSGQKQE